MLSTWTGFKRKLDWARVDYKYHKNDISTSGGVLPLNVKIILQLPASLLRRHTRKHHSEI
jgi:hypothetical protein